MIFHNLDGDRFLLFPGGYFFFWPLRWGIQLKLRNWIRDGHWSLFITVICGEFMIRLPLPKRRPRGLFHAEWGLTFVSGTPLRINWEHWVGRYSHHRSKWRWRNDIEGWTG